MAVGQVDDVCNRRQHGSLAAGADDGVSFAHCQQQLTSTHTQEQNVISDSEMSDRHLKRLAESGEGRKTKERCVLCINNTIFLMPDKRLKRLTERSESALFTSMHCLIQKWLPIASQF